MYLEEETFKKYIEEKELGIKCLSIVYIILITAIYICLYLYINSNSSREIIGVQSFLLLIVTTILGNYSKELYLNLTNVILNYQEKMITPLIRSYKMFVTVWVNYITVILLLSYMGKVILDLNNVYFHIVGVLFSILLMLVGVITIFFKISSYEDQE